MNQKYNRIWMVLTLMLVLMTLPVLPSFAQDGDTPTFADDVATNLEAVGKKMIALAEATPENMFSWRPTVEVRSVSEVFMHTVGTNLLILPGLGAPMPEGVEIPEAGVFALFAQWEGEVTSKEEVIEWLKKSFEYAQANVGAIEDLEAESQLFGFPATKRAYILIILSHAHEHLGQAISYTRSMGLVPPWSRPAPAPPSEEEGE